MSTHDPLDARTHEHETASSACEGLRLVIISLPEDRDATLAVLHETLNFGMLDAKIRLNHLPGLLPEVFPRDVAEEAARRWRALGGEGLTIPDREIPHLDHARTLHHVELAPNGLAILGLSGRIEEIVPWQQFALLSIGVVPLSEGRRETDWSGGAIHAAPVAPSETLKTRRMGPELWLTTESPFRAFHIEHEAMNYECLGERKSTSATANFSVLLEDLMRYVPEIFLTRSARAFLERDSADLSRFATQEAHRDDMLAQVLVMRSFRSRFAPPSAPETPPGRTSVMNVARPSQLQQRKHLERLERIQELRDWWHQICELGEPRLDELNSRLVSLSNIIREHFADEEQPPSTCDVADLPPRLQTGVARLRQEQQVILDELDALTKRLQSENAHLLSESSVCQDLEQTLGHLERHEHAENALDQDKFRCHPSLGDESQ